MTNEGRPFEIKPMVILLKNDVEYANVVIPAGIKVIVHQELISEKHLDPFWYGGEPCAVLRVEYKGRQVFLDAPGDIRLVVHENDRLTPMEELSEYERRIRGPWDLTGAEVEMGDAFFEGLPDNAWWNNNWYELFYHFEGDAFTDAYEGEAMYDYSEALAEALRLVQDDQFWL